MSDTISTHTTAEGWPHDPGTPVWWHNAHGERCEGFYLRLDIDDLEECWGRPSERDEFISRMEGNDSTCTECSGDLDDDGDCENGCEPFPGEHKQSDAIRYQAAYGIAARILARKPARVIDAAGRFLSSPTAVECRDHIDEIFAQDPEAFDYPTDVPLNAIFPIQESTP